MYISPLKNTSNFSIRTVPVHSSNIYFKGDFFTFTDVHLRTDRKAQLLSEIEKRCKNKEMVIVLDGGDNSTTGVYPEETDLEINCQFAQRNPNIKTIINLGNCDIGLYDKEPERFHTIVKKMNDCGITVLSANLALFAGKEVDGVKPYEIINKDGEKLFITGLGTYPKISSENQKEALKKIIKPAINQEKPDKVILMSHNFSNITKELLDYAKNDLNIKNLSLIIGGHPHSIMTNFINEPVVYPPASGKGMFELGYNKEGKFNLDAFIANKNLKIHDSYAKIIQQCDKEQHLRDVIAKSTLKLDLRGNNKISMPSKMGTFLADNIRKRANADIGLLLTMDLREDLPPPGENITLYNLKDSLNVDKSIKTLNVDINTLKQIFEISLKDQVKGNSNSDFMEYSPNIRIKRAVYENKDLSDPKPNKVRQIYIKNKEGHWETLLDKDGKSLFPDRTYKVATCYFIAEGRRDSLFLFRTLKSDFTPLTTLQVFRDAIKEAEKSETSEYEASKITNF